MGDLQRLRSLFGEFLVNNRPENDIRPCCTWNVNFKPSKADEKIVNNLILMQYLQFKWRKREKKALVINFLPMGEKIPFSILKWKVRDSS